MNHLFRNRDLAPTWLKSRRGAIVILAAVMMIIFLVAVAFSVDVAYMQLARTQLRVATDAAARAAGEALSREQDIDQSRQAARDIALANLVAADPLLLDDSDIVFGESTQQANGSWLFTPDGEPINSVRVFGRRTRDAPSGSVATFFGRVANVFDFEPIHAATVVRLDRDICVVVDRSSSMKLFLTDTSATMSTSDARFCQPPDMANSRWGGLSIAIDRFLDALDTTPQIEHVGLVSYGGLINGSWPSSLCGYKPPATIDSQLQEDFSALRNTMDGLSGDVWNGRTNISEGIARGIDVLTDPDSARPFAAKTMVLMSDGAWNEGVKPSLTAAQAAQEDIVIHTITYGEADPAEMQAIADATGGNHYIAPNVTALQDIFEEIALTLPVIFTD